MFFQGTIMGQDNRIDHDTEEAVRRFLGLIAGHYDMAGAILYGSRARGTHHPDSDADVAVLLKGEHQRFLITKLDMAKVAFDVLLETDILISPLPIWLDEWENPENYSNPALLYNIDREGVRL
jgi:predicted nucleotidyltransferase